MRKDNRVKWVVVSLSLYTLAGCAGLDYVKVPTATQHDSWTDRDQHKADAMKGVRYYLPRPFLHLKESIPVAQRVAFISFHLDPDQKVYVLDLPENAPTWVTSVAPKKISITQALAATLASTQVAAARPEAGTPGAETGPAPAEAPAPPSTLKATTGFTNQSDPVTALSAKMDVVYLPDFEEQYVIRPRTGLGKADIETRLRNGWAAEVFSQNLDNSQVIPYVIKQVEQASQAAAGIATTWMPMAMGLPPGTSPATLLELMGVRPGAAKMEAGAVGEATGIAEQMLGNVLLFKIAEVRVAQPGIYPVLKPREIKQWLKYEGAIEGPDAQARFEEFLTQAKVPWVRADMAFVPCPPFTVVGFNTTTDVFLTPATGRTVIAQSLPPSPGGGQSEEAGREIAAALVRKRADLKRDTGLVDEQNIEAKPSPAGNQTVITIKSPPTVLFASDVKEIQQWIINMFNAAGDSKLSEADVKVDKSPDARTVTITIGRDIGTLANQAKKVQ
jgi:hypothetical protein